MTKIVQDVAPKILEAIKASKNILLHCHPLPDPDSVCSALAMKFVLEGMNKKAIVIKGDSNIPAAFMHFPGAKDIVQKNFSEVDLKEFDLFIALDSGSPSMVSRLKTPVFPLSIPTVVIDHHDTNDMYGNINLVDVSSPAVCFTLFQLFKEWKVVITPETATNLFIGMYTDSGGFKYPPTNYKVLEVASELVKIAPNYTQALFVMENSQTKEAIYFQALALSSVKTFLNDTVAIASVSNKDLQDKKIPEEYIRGISISNILKSVVGWNIGISAIEQKPQRVKVSLRTRDAEKYDVSKLAEALGGGGHKAAAAAVLTMPLPEAIEKIVDTAKEIYNL